MKTLAIDTSSNICSVCIMEENTVLIEKTNNDEKTHSQKLMPMIKEIFEECKISLDDIDLIVCCQGPGSFTGIRIGIATAKAFSDVKNIPTIGITSLESLAHNINKNGLIVSLLDAKHNNIYGAVFESKNGIYKNIIEPIADSLENFLEKISSFNEPIIFVGNGAINYKSQISSHIPKSIFVDEKLNQQNGTSLAKAGIYKYKNSDKKNLQLLPIYLKKSQAERQLNGEK